jgi:hypothetical protein
MKKSILNFMLAGALCLGTGLPIVAQDSAADQAFARYDADKDGKLSAAEFGKVTTSDGKKASIQDWDADGDGAVSKSEFAAKYAASSGSGSQGSPQPSQPKK